MYQPRSVVTTVAEIRALLEAARRRYPQAGIHVLFQPHLFSRTKYFAHEFAEALSFLPGADDFALTPDRYLEQVSRIKAAVAV